MKKQKMNIENGIMGGNRFRSYSKEFKNAHVGADSISAQDHRGITLIALVITIIILLILAGVVINLTLGEHGILKKAEQGLEQYKISEILEKLELEKVDLVARKNGEIPSLQEYINHLINKGIITLADVTDIDDNNKNIVVEGYLFLVEKEGNGNIKITYGGKATKEPKLANLQITETTVNSISVKVVASNADGASYKYSIKNLTNGETTFTEVTTIPTNEYTFTGLTINNDYIIQVELIISGVVDTKETSTIKTEPPKVTSIVLDKTNIELIKGGTDKITATVLPENAGDKTITWASSNDDVVTVDNSGNITAVGEGVAIITVASNEVSTVTANCNITVTPPPPPTVGAGGTTHTAKQIQYTWEELNSIAKVISDNYGLEEGQINNDTAEVNVSINGKADTLGVGDWTTVKYGGADKKVRILGFNHDELTDKAVYGGTNTYAGISFGFVDYIMESGINSTNSNVGGWGATTLRNTINEIAIINNITTDEGVSIGNKIKTVNKGYNIGNAQRGVLAETPSEDKLWLLAASEVWDGDEGYTGFHAGYSDTVEGTQYRLYKGSMSMGNGASLNEVEGIWWLRSTNETTVDYYTAILRGGLYQTNVLSSSWRVVPGFAI